MFILKYIFLFAGILSVFEVDLNDPFGLKNDNGKRIHYIYIEI